MRYAIHFLMLRLNVLLGYRIWMKGEEPHINDHFADIGNMVGWLDEELGEHRQKITKAKKGRA